MRTRWRDILFGMVLLGLGISAGGCGGSVESTEPPQVQRAKASEGPSGDKPVDDIPTRLAAKAMPLDAFIETPRETAIFDYAVQVLASKCMKERGYEFGVPRFEALASWYAWDVDYQRARLFGLTDRAEASVYGYGEPMPPEKPSPEFGNGSATLREYRGRGDHSLDDPGCRPMAEAAVFDRTEPEYNASPLPVRLRIQASQKASAKADYQVVFRELGQCLRDRGYDIPDPTKPFASPSMQKIMGGGMERDYGSRAPSAEVKVALADIDCKVEVDLVRRLERIVGSVEADLIEANALALDEYQEMHDKALRRATKVMNGDVS